jgi:hypothetical protein
MLVQKQERQQRGLVRFKLSHENRVLKLPLEKDLIGKTTTTKLGRNF